MSSLALVFALKNLGGGFKTKSPASAAGSGFGAPREDVVESGSPG